MLQTFSFPLLFGNVRSEGVMNIKPFLIQRPKAPDAAFQRKSLG